MHHNSSDIDRRSKYQGTVEIKYRDVRSIQIIIQHITSFNEPGRIVTALLNWYFDGLTRDYVAQLCEVGMWLNICASKSNIKNVQKNTKIRKKKLVGKKTNTLP